jgi:hypothetical protein
VLTRPDFNVLRDACVTKPVHGRIH